MAGKIAGGLVGRPRAASASAVARAESLGPVGDRLRAFFRARRERLRLMTNASAALPPAMNSRPSAPSPHRSSQWGEGRGEGRVRAPAVWADLSLSLRGKRNALACPCPSPQPSPHGVKNAAGRGGVHIPGLFAADGAGAAATPVRQICGWAGESRAWRVRRAAASSGRPRAASASAVTRAESSGAGGDQLRALFPAPSERLRLLTKPRRNCRRP
jgi:hypothetical protein